MSTLLAGDYNCQYNYNCVGLGSSLHFVVNELMDFKLDLLKESYKADHGLSIL